jgi:hemoglobin
MRSTLKRISLSGMTAFACAVAACTAGDPAKGSAADSTLYRRLGGYDAIASVTDSFLARIQRDTAISAFFAGLEPAQLSKIRQLVVDQLCAASGGPCLYVGRPMKETHATLDITSDVFDRFVGHFRETLVAFKVPQREQDEVLSALDAMKSDVVSK